jgi:hypothetical protein
MGEHLQVQLLLLMEFGGHVGMLVTTRGASQTASENHVVAAAY